MATKKQKHAAGLAKREAFLAEEAEIGRRSIEVAQRRREAEMLKAWERGHVKHFKFVDECPHCTAIKEEQARRKAAEVIERLHAAATKKAAGNNLSPETEIEDANASDDLKVSA